MIFINKVIDQFNLLDKYTVLILDEFSPPNYYYFLIDGEKYHPVPIYDAKNTIAIERVNKTFLGKTIEFI